MAAPTLLELTEAIAARLRSIDDVYVHDQWEGATEFPALVVMAPTSITYRETMGGANGARPFEVEVMALAQPADQGTLLYAQTLLCELADFTGAKSVYAAIEADRTLGAVVAQCFVESYEALGADEVAGVGCWAGRFRLKIQATR